MVRLAVRRACAALADVRLAAALEPQADRHSCRGLVLRLLVPAAFGWFAPDAARLSFARWLLGSSERWPQRTYLTVMGLDARGRLVVPRDERWLLEVRTDLPLIESRGGRWVVGGRGEPLVLSRKPERPAIPQPVMVRERTADGSTRAGVMVEAEPGAIPLRVPAGVGLVDIRAEPAATTGSNP